MEEENVLQFAQEGQDNRQENMQQPPPANEPTPALTPVNPIRRFGLSLIPFSPVPFTDPLAYVRLGLYGTIAYLTFNRARPISYFALGALVVSGATSTAGGFWSKQNGN